MAETGQEFDPVKGIVKKMVTKMGAMGGNRIYPAARQAANILEGKGKNPQPAAPETPAAPTSADLQGAILPTPDLAPAAPVTPAAPPAAPLASASEVPAPGVFEDQNLAGVDSNRMDPNSPAAKKYELGATSPQTTPDNQTPSTNGELKQTDFLNLAPAASLDGNPAPDAAQSPHDAWADQAVQEIVAENNGQKMSEDEARKALMGRGLSKQTQWLALDGLRQKGMVATSADQPVAPALDAFEPANKTPDENAFEDQNLSGVDSGQFDPNSEAAKEHQLGETSKDEINIPEKYRGEELDKGYDAAIDRLQEASDKLIALKRRNRNSWLLPRLISNLKSKIKGEPSLEQQLKGATAEYQKAKIDNAIYFAYDKVMSKVKNEELSLNSDQREAFNLELTSQAAIFLNDEVKMFEGDEIDANSRGRLRNFVGKFLDNPKNRTYLGYALTGTMLISSLAGPAGVPAGMVAGLARAGLGAYGLNQTLSGIKERVDSHPGKKSKAVEKAALYEYRMAKGDRDSLGPEAALNGILGVELTNALKDKASEIKDSSPESLAKVIEAALAEQNMEGLNNDRLNKIRKFATVNKGLSALFGGFLGRNIIAAGLHDLVPQVQGAEHALAGHLPGHEAAAATSPSSGIPESSGAHLGTTTETGVNPDAAAGGFHGEIIDYQTPGGYNGFLDAKYVEAMTGTKQTDPAVVGRLLYGENGLLSQYGPSLHDAFTKAYGNNFLNLNPGAIKDNTIFGTFKGPDLKSALDAAKSVLATPSAAPAVAGVIS